MPTLQPDWDPTDRFLAEAFQEYDESHDLTKLVWRFQFPSDPWLILVKALSQSDVEFVRVRCGAIQVQRFRFGRFRIYRKALRAVAADLRLRLAATIAASRDQAKWNFGELVQQEYRMRSLLFRLQIAGTLFVLNVPHSQTIGKNAIAEIEAWLAPADAVLA